MLRQLVDRIYPISSQSMGKLEELCKSEKHLKGTTFIGRNRPDSNEYFVVDGICRSYLVTPEGEDITISFYPASSVLAPYIIRTKNGISNMYFQASTDIELISLDAGAFEKLMIENLEIRNFGNAVLKNELEAKVRKEIGLTSLTAKERLLQFRQDFHMLENLVPHGEIASYLGITTISLSRLRGNLP